MGCYENVLEPPLLKETLEGISTNARKKSTSCFASCEEQVASVFPVAYDGTQQFFQVLLMLLCRSRREIYGEKQPIIES